MLNFPFAFFLKISQTLKAHISGMEADINKIHVLRAVRESAVYHRFFSFSQNQIFKCVCLSVRNCSSVENILDTFCVAQIWYDLSTLTHLKCPHFTNLTQNTSSNLKIEPENSRKTMFLSKF